MTHCFTAANQANIQAAQMQQGYAARIKEDNMRISAAQSKFFGWVADPKLLEAKIGLPDGAEKTISQIRDDFFALIPPYRRSSIEADIAANLFVAYNILQGDLRAARAEKTVAELKTEETRHTEPTSEMRPSSNGSGRAINGVKTFSLEGMPS